MVEVLRSRDCIVWSKSAITTVAVSDAMVSSGWAGGQGVQWTNSLGNERVVTYSNGLFGGYLIWGSNESSDQYTAMTKQHIAYKYGVMVFSGSLMATTTYERYTYASRLAGPLVPLSYTSNQPLRLSLRGYWTNEDEMSVTSHVQAPSPVVGFVAQIPKSVNNNFLGIQVVM